MNLKFLGLLGNRILIRITYEYITNEYKSVAGGIVINSGGECSGYHKENFVLFKAECGIKIDNFHVIIEEPDILAAIFKEDL